MVVRGPDTDPIGRVRDIVVHIRPPHYPSRVLGLVVELVNKRRIFVPMLRVAAIEPGDITLASGSVSMRVFKPRTGELTIVGDIFGSNVHSDDPELEHLHNRALPIADVELERTRTQDWVLSGVAVYGAPPRRFSRSRELVSIPWKYVHGLSPSYTGHSDAVEAIITSFDDMHPADVANYLHELTESQRHELANALNDERLADVLQEMPDDRQTELLESLDIDRAADILEEMDPDDAADLLQEMPDNKAEVLLELMDPEESAPVRRMMSFQPDTVGALMTPEPLIVTPQTTVAEALAMARNPDFTTSLASLIFVVRPPTATPTGSYLGCVHLQKLLREPPSSLVSGSLDPDLPPLWASDSHETAARYFATYNLVCGPVVDENHHLLGAVAVDDLLDHLLPEDWRESGLRPGEAHPTPPGSRSRHSATPARNPTEGRVSHDQPF